MTVRVGTITDYFLSSHTGRGYHSFLEHTLADLKQIIIFKGGSIQIKSRIIRNIGIKLVDRGFNVELLHGVDNAYNLEGVIVPEIKLALVDGRYHKGIEHRLSEASILVVNLDEFVDKEKFKVFKSKILDVQEQLDVNIELLYEELHEVKNSMDFFSVCAIPENQITEIVEKISKSLFFIKQGKIYHRFAQCLTGGGEVSYYHNLLKDIKKRYFLNGIDYKNACKILRSVAHEGTKVGLRVEAYHNYLEPKYIELLILPELSLAISAKAVFKDFQAILNYKDIQKGIIYLNHDDNSNNGKTKLDLSKVLERLVASKELDELLSDLYQGTLDYKGIEELENEIFLKVLNLS